MDPNIRQSSPEIVNTHTGNERFWRSEARETPVDRSLVMARTSGGPPVPAPRSMMIRPRRRNRGFWPALWLLLLLNGCMPSDSPPKAIQSAAAVLEDEALFAQAALSPDYLNHLLKLLKHGEPIVARYRFRFYRVNDWLGDYRLLQVIIKRRLRLRLISERFEMLDITNDRTHLTSDPEEAMGFIGHPRYIPLSGRVRLRPDRRYRLDVHLDVEHEGMSDTYRLLNRWLSFGHSGAFSFQSPFEPT